MIIRGIEFKDAEAFWNMQSELDKETKFMMYEPGERKKDLTRVKSLIQDVKEHSHLLLVAENESKIVGFIMAQRGISIRNRHRAYIVIGIREAFHGQGIGKRFFKELDIWANKNSLRRLYLTVMTHNTRAKQLYEQNGFTIEGIKKDSMYIDGKYVDEYYMAKIL